MGALENSGRCRRMESGVLCRGTKHKKFDAGDAIEIHTPGGGGFGRRET